jgi:hypothetical protein
LGSEARAYHGFIVRFGFLGVSSASDVTIGFISLPNCARHRLSLAAVELWSDMQQLRSIVIGQKFVLRVM